MTNITLLLDNHGKPVAATDTEEEGTTLLHRVRSVDAQAANWKTRTLPVVSGEIQPLTFYIRAARISNREEAFSMGTVEHLVWPFEAGAYPSKAAWIWQKPTEDFGILRVAGFDQDKVDALYQAVSEAFRLDAEMRAPWGQEDGWMALRQYAGRVMDLM